MGERIGILHPGQMGFAVALTAKNSGNEVYWTSHARSAATRARALQAGLTDAGTLAELCEACSIVISVCPPEFAEDIATRVQQTGFSGLYVDANAISPERVQRIGAKFDNFVDGGIVGLPPTQRGRSWLYLSGENAARVSDCLNAGPLEVEVLGDTAGTASALKMCFAAHTKTTRALFAVVLATAERLGVLEDLKRQWARSGPSFEKVASEISEAAPKAWRWAAEMHEIEATLESVGMPPGFHQAAAEVCERLKGFKDAQPTLAEVLAAL